MTHLLTDHEAAELLRVNVRRLRRIVVAGQLASIDLGDGTMRIDPDDLTAFIDEHRKSAMPPTMLAAAPA